MQYKADDINALLREFLKSPQGRKYTEENNINVTAYTEADMKRIGMNLRQDIIAAYQSLVKDPYGQFDILATTVYAPTVKKKNVIVTILFRSTALKRPSLWGHIKGENGYSGHGYTGTGVYDIFGLFTQGYSTTSEPGYTYGAWLHPDGSGNGDYTDIYSNGIIRSCNSRAANDFINGVIHKYQVLYPDVEFRWPALWGGNM